MLYRTAKSTLALLLIIVGIILTPMPVPFGIIMIILGLAILASVNHRVRGWITDIRRRFPGFSNALHNVKHKLPSMMRQLIDDTEPHVK